MWWLVSFWRWQRGKGQRRQKTNQNAFCSKNSSIVATKVIYNCSVILGSWGSVFNFQEWVRFRCSNGLKLYKMGYIYPKDDKTHRVFCCIMILHPVNSSFPEDTFVYLSMWRHCALPHASPPSMSWTWWPCWERVHVEIEKHCESWLVSVVSPKKVMTIMLMGCVVLVVVTLWLNKSRGCSSSKLSGS